MLVALYFWMHPVLYLPANTWWIAHVKQTDMLRGLGVVSAWRSGIWDARLFPAFDWGYGYPNLSYYAPLFSWMTGLGLLVISPANWVARIVIWIWLFYGTIGAYLAGRRLWNYLAGGQADALKPGLFTAGAWLMSPYLLFDAYTRGDGPEFAAACTLPWIIWAGVGVLGQKGPLTRRDHREWLLLTLFLSLAILSHNFVGLLAAAMAAVMVPAMVVLRWAGGERSLRPAMARGAVWVAGLGLALGTTLFFWLPAMWEMPFTQAHVVAEGAYRYALHFIKPERLFYVNCWPRNPYSWRADGYRYGAPLHLGWIGFGAVASLLIGLVLALPRRLGAGRMVAGIVVLTAGAGLGAFLFFPASQIVWKYAPLLHYAQFPWRLLLVPSLFLALLFPAAGSAAWVRWPQSSVRRWILGGSLAILIGVFAASAANYMRVSRTMWGAGDLDMNTWSQRAISATDIDEFASIWRPRFRAASAPAGSLMPDAPLLVEQVRQSRLPMEFTVVNPGTQPAGLTVAYNYYPGWCAWRPDDGLQMKVEPVNGSGFLRIVEIPPGRSAIKLQFGDTPLRRWFKVVSLLAWVAWVTGLVWALRRQGDAGGSGAGDESAAPAMASC
jgi:hypothetical protein